MRILFISSSYVGDAILSTGLLGHLMAAYPQARFWVACGPGPAPLFEANPRVEHVHVMRKDKRAGHWFRLLKKVWPRRWDMVVDLRGSATSYVLWTRKRHVFRPDHTVTRVESFGQVLDLSPPPSPVVWTDAVAEARARELIPEGRRVLVIAPTANWPKKMWPEECYLELAQRLTGPGGLLEGADIMIQGGPGEREQVPLLYEALPKDRLIDQMGSDLVTAAACFRRVSLFVGNDSGLMHLAAAAGAPTLGLFGPTRDDLYAPWGVKAAAVRGPLSCAEIRGNPGYDHSDPVSEMRDLTVERVEEAARALLERLSKGSTT